MKKYIYIFISALIALVSCVESPEAQHATSQRAVSLEAVTTKTTYDGEKIVWESGDKVNVFFHHPDNGVYVTEFSSNIAAGQTSDKSKFSGNIHTDVTVENGYNDFGYAVYPHTAAFEGEVLKYNLPSTQNADESGSFQSGINLSSSVVDLSDLNENGSVTAHFRNALAFVKIQLSEDVASVTLTGTAPLSGTAPLEIGSDPDVVTEYGRLRVVEGEWGSNSVTLCPPEGGSFEKKDYTVLIWPGEHDGLTVTMTFNELGEYGKTSDFTSLGGFAFSSNKTYRLNLRNTEELVIEEILDGVELPEVDSDLTDDIEGLLSQVQSVSLMTENLDNTVYAQYAQLTYSKQKLDLILDYIIKPESAVDGLVEAFNEDPSALSAVYGYTTEEGFELQNGQLAVKSLDVKELPGVGKIVTASVDASWLDDRFYAGQFGASVALQVAAGKSSILSDFAYLLPKSGSVFSGSYLQDITAVPGAEIIIPFSFATSSDEFTIAVTGQENVTSARVTSSAASRTGNLFVGISDSNPIDSQTVTLTLTTEDETVSNTFTFVDNGARINLSSDGDVDWIGGEVKVTAETTNLGSSGGYFSTSGAGLSYSNGIFAFDENTGAERTATVTYEVSLGSLRFNKSISVRQKAYGSELSRTYYTDGADLELKAATAGYTPLNIVVLGDGYKKKDLAAGGKFERSARQVLTTFFAVQPYKDFEDRFSVHMIGFESAEEGTDITSESITKDTYFNSSFTGGGSTYATSDKDKIATVVRGKFANDADFYRTVVILLVNTDLVAGSCDYTAQTTISTDIVGDGFASFSIATLPANTTNVNGLIRHELGGHGFGRLGDEYSQDWYTQSIIEQRHSVGFYYNVATDTSYWSKFTNAGYGSDEVQYDQYMDGPLYRSTNMNGIMWNNNGSFNAVSRWAIYERIRKQTEGYGDYWSDFLSWDQKNR